MTKKEKVSIIIFLVIICLAIIIPISIYVASVYKIRSPYVQEYVAGTGNIKGDVCVECFEEKSSDLAIGADKNGYAVFKNPRKAFSYVKKNYKKGIKLIKKEFNLGSFNQFNYNSYKNLGWQTTTGTLYEKDEANFITIFLDIYENSFE